MNTNKAALQDCFLVYRLLRVGYRVTHGVLSMDNKSDQLSTRFNAVDNVSKQNGGSLLRTQRS